MGKYVHIAQMQLVWVNLYWKKKQFNDMSKVNWSKTFRFVVL